MRGVIGLNAPASDGGKVTYNKIKAAAEKLSQSPDFIKVLREMDK